MKLEERAKNISSALKEWFEKTGETKTTPEEVIQYLIEKGIYTANSRNNAVKLRNDLRKLAKNGLLNKYIEEARYKCCNIYKRWTFEKVCK